MGMKKEEAVKSANKLPESPEGEFRAIDDISLYCLQYAMSCLWDSVPPEKTSERSKRLFKELCDSLEYDFGGTRTIMFAARCSSASTIIRTTRQKTIKTRKTRNKQPKAGTKNAPHGRIFCLRGFRAGAQQGAAFIVF